MTTPASSPPNGPPNATVAPGDQGTVDAVQRALAAEHAALWTLQLATAFVTDEVAPAVAEATGAHRARRDATELLLRDHGAVPVAAEPAYATPAPVTDQASAIALLTTAESDVAAAWRSAIEYTDDQAVRTLAVDSLTDAAVRATRWRRTAGTAPLTVPFPGAPG